MLPFGEIKKTEQMSSFMHEIHQNKKETHIFILSVRSEYENVLVPSVTKLCLTKQDQAFGTIITMFLLFFIRRF